MTKLLEIIGIGVLAFIGCALCNNSDAKPVTAPAAEAPNEHEQLQPDNEPTPCRSARESDPPAKPEQPPIAPAAESDVQDEGTQIDPV